MAGICERCDNESLMFANMPMFPSFCFVCDPVPKGVIVIQEEE